MQIPTLALSLELPQIKTWFGDVLEMRIPKETGFWHFPGGGGIIWAQPCMTPNSEGKPHNPNKYTGPKRID